MTRIKFAIALVVVALVAMPLRGHHPFTVEFDWRKPVTVTGVVTKLDWENPHAYLHVEAQDAGGMARNWSFEMGSLSAIGKAGWTKQTVKPGDEVSIDGWLSRSPAKPTTANMKTIRLPNGLELSGASSAGDTEPHERIEPKRRTDQRF